MLESETGWWRPGPARNSPGLSRKQKYFGNDPGDSSNEYLCNGFELDSDEYPTRLLVKKHQC